MTTHVYGNGTNSTSGANTITHYYDRAGIESANRVNVFQQFASRKSMPKKSGKTFKISRWEHIYDRSTSHPDFAAKGFLSSRTLEEVNASLNSALLAEGAGAVNKRTIHKMTVSAPIARYGEMIEYTDEVDLFSEDYIQVRYRQELGDLANVRHEDLIMRDLLSTTTVMFNGLATSIAEIGTGVEADGTNDDEYKVSYDLLRKATRKLLRNRAKKTREVITGSTKIDTRTVAAAYSAIIGAEVKADLETMTRGENAATEFVYIPAHQYANAGNLAEGEVGAMNEIRFIEAEGMATYAGKGAPVPVGYTGTLATTDLVGADAVWIQNTGSSAATLTGASGISKDYGSLAAGAFLKVDTAADAVAAATVADVEVVEAKFNAYPILFPSQDAFATIGLKGQGKIKFDAKSPSDVGLDNPYGTRGFFSYNFFYGGILLREEQVLNLVVAASA